MGNEIVFSQDSCHITSPEASYLYGRANDAGAVTDEAKKGIPLHRNVHF